MIKNFSLRRPKPLASQLLELIWYQTSCRKLSKDRTFL